MCEPLRWLTHFSYCLNDIPESCHHVFLHSLLTIHCNSMQPQGPISPQAIETQAIGHQFQQLENSGVLPQHVKST